MDVALLEAAPQDLTLRLAFQTGGRCGGGAPDSHGAKPSRGSTWRFPTRTSGRFGDPFLYEVEAHLAGTGLRPDVVKTYFGMRKISVVNLPGTDHPYVALNGEPVYLQLTLDQAYHPEGFYTFPSDEFVRNEVLRARQIGLNGLREHVKVESAAQALLGRPARRADHGRRAQLVGRAHEPRCGRRSRRPCAR